MYKVLEMCAVCGCDKEYFFNSSENAEKKKKTLLESTMICCGIPNNVYLYKIETED